MRTDDEVRRRAGDNIRHVDIKAHAIAVIAVEGDALAVVRPHDVAMQRFAIRDEAYAVIREAVVVDLRVLVATVILKECEAFGAGALRSTCGIHRLGVVRELLAHRQR